jgi:hypothetical protein
MAGNGQLGIAALEDKIVQAAVVRVLNQIWEEDFVDFSYGFRPGRSQHDALDALYVGITGRKMNYGWTWTFGHFSTESSMAIWKSSYGIGWETNGSSV